MIGDGPLDETAYQRLRSSERRPASFDALLEGVGEADLTVTVRNLSCSGMLAASATPLRVGQFVLVRLAGLEPRPALIRWKQEDVYGFAFQRGLTGRQLLDVFRRGGVKEAERPKYGFASTLRAALGRRRNSTGSHQDRP